MTENKKKRKEKDAIELSSVGREFNTKKKKKTNNDLTFRFKVNDVTCQCVKVRQAANTSSIARALLLFSPKKKKIKKSKKTRLPHRFFFSFFQTGRPSQSSPPPLCQPAAPSWAQPPVFSVAKDPQSQPVDYFFDSKKHLKNSLSLFLVLFLSIHWLTSCQVRLSSIDIVFVRVTWSQQLIWFKIDTQNLIKFKSILYGLVLHLLL